MNLYILISSNKIMDSVFDWLRKCGTFPLNATDDFFLNMSHLILSNSKITYIHEDIGKLTNLIEVSFMGRNLAHLPDSIGNLEKLEKLNIRKNKFTNLPESLANLKNLKELDLRYNNLDSNSKNVLEELVMTSSAIIKLETDNFDFEEELAKHRKGEPATGRTTAKAAEY